VTYEVVGASGAPEPVRSFLAYAVSPAGEAEATRVGYAPLPEGLRRRVEAAVAGLR
jgi:phosphate transport system substrate-binding protein